MFWNSYQEQRLLDQQESFPKGQLTLPAMVELQERQTFRFWLFVVVPEKDVVDDDNKQNTWG